MTDKRLKEIKDSIDLQLEIAKQLNVDNELLLEEKELYEYAEELKKQLEEANKKLYLCTPEIPQNVHEEYVSYVDLVNEIYELKKQLEKATKPNYYVKGLESTLKEYQQTITNYENQQQEFIKYMEDKVKYFKDLEQFAIKTFINKAVINLDLVKISINEDRIVIENLEEILAKYKEIIGTDIYVGSKGENKDE